MFASKLSALERIEYFNEHTGFFSTVFFPLLFATIFFITKPYISAIGKKFTSGADIISKQDEFRHQIEIDELTAKQALIQEQLNTKIHQEKAEQIAIQEKTAIAQVEREQEAIKKFDDEYLKKEVANRLSKIRTDNREKIFNNDVNRVMEGTINTLEAEIHIIQNRINSLENHGASKDQISKELMVINKHESLIENIKNSIAASKL